MIRINLIKEQQKGAAKRSFSLDIKSLKSIQLQELFKGSSEYYLGLLLWFAVVGVFAYYLKLTRERAHLEERLKNLNSEKARLQARAKKLIEDTKLVQNRVEELKRKISELQKSKEIIAGLKGYYKPFNSSLSLYTSKVPRSSWLTLYRQSFDLNQNRLISEFELNSFDYESISAYGKMLERSSSLLSFKQIERKLSAHGYEFYTIKLSAENFIQDVR